MLATDLNVPYHEIAAFCQRNRIHLLSAFGSAVRDDFRPDCDLDLLVEFEPEARVGFLALSRMRRELTALFGRQVDLVPRSGLKPLICDVVLANAELVYAV